MLKGLGASQGIEMGKALVLAYKEAKLERKSGLDASAEISRLEASRQTAKNQLQELYDITVKKMGCEKAQIFDSQILMLGDDELFSQVKDKLKKESINAEWALHEVSEVFRSMFESIPDEYMRERAVDLKDITHRLLDIMLGIEKPDLSMLKERAIIAARDLMPSDTAKMDKERVIAFVTEAGGRTSHTAIIAKTLGIPAIVGVDGLMAGVKSGDVLIANGDTGEVYINPNEKEINRFIEDKKRYEHFTEILKGLKDSHSISKDGVKVEIAANIGTPEDIQGVLKNGAEGIGLFRSEFLYMERKSLPSEEEQFQAYKEVAAGINGKPVVIRTLDVGGDKELEYLQIPKEENPFMGYRAIRLCLGRKDIFKTQLRALLRASAFGNIKIMFPMISSIQELRQAKALLEEVKAGLRVEKIEFNENIEVGIMIEIPAAALISDLLAREADFFSIGTNDLIQYTTAVDRMNPKVSHLYNQYHPALLRLIRLVIGNAHKQGIWVGMCGEAAGDSKLIPVWMGMDLNEFSMSSGSILKARWIVKNTSVSDMEKLVDQVINMSTAEEVEKLLEENLTKISSTNL